MRDLQAVISFLLLELFIVNFLPELNPLNPINNYTSVGPLAGLLNN